MTETQITIAYKDFKLLERAVSVLKPNAQPEASIRIIHVKPDTGTYELFLEINTSINGIAGTFKTEIFGDE